MDGEANLVISVICKKMSSTENGNGGLECPRDRLLELLEREENTVCADCTEPYPTWASTNWGAFICTQCAGVHRSLGVEHSFVLSVSLDNWTHSQVDHMAENGNHKVNALLEHNVPKTIEVPCLSYTDRDTREKYIHAKYVHQLFKQVGNRNPRAPERVVRKPSPSRSPPNTRKAHSAMVEYIGIVTVLIEECRDLVIKDLLSSDPYCVLTIGSQSSKTTTKYKCLDPKYNETFNFSWDGVDPLVVQVFDKDELTKDDHMGLVELDLAPLLRKEGMVLEGWFPVRHRKKDKQQGEMRLEITFTQIK